MLREPKLYGQSWVILITKSHKQGQRSDCKEKTILNFFACLEVSNLAPTFSPPASASLFRHLRPDSSRNFPVRWRPTTSCRTKYLFKSTRRWNYLSRFKSAFFYFGHRFFGAKMNSTLPNDFDTTTKRTWESVLKKSLCQLFSELFGNPAVVIVVADGSGLRSGVSGVVDAIPLHLGQDLAQLRRLLASCKKKQKSSSDEPSETLSWNGPSLRF